MPRTPNTTAGRQRSAIVGIAVNGVAIFGNYAAPGDDIYTEARTFDRCGAHPQGGGVYHYHSEPYAITNDDDRFAGVMLDGYPIYGRKDADGTYPQNLDAYGGHTSATPDSLTATYHYHVNSQTSTSAGTPVLTDPGRWSEMMPRCRFLPNIRRPSGAVRAAR